MYTPITLLKDLTEIHAVSGYEDDMIRFLGQQMSTLVDQIRVDKTGNITAIRQGEEKDSPRVMFFAHMDEVGFMVRKRETSGHLRLLSLGGNPKSLPGQEVQIRTFDGRFLRGVFEIKSAHLTESSEWEKSAGVEDLYLMPIDDGDGIRAEVGYTVSFQPNFRRLENNLVSSKALDNRVGCFVLLEVLRRLQGKKINATVAFTGTVQEEISCSGSLAPAQAFGADIAIAVDGTVSYDMPGTSPEGEVCCGGGPVITRFLRTPGLNGWTPNPKLALYIEKIAEENKISIQRDAVYGLMSDAKPLLLGGIPSAVIGIPMRGKHSPAEIISLDDVEQTVQLIVALIQNIDQKLDIGRG